MTVHRLHAHGNPMPSSWQERLDAASTEEEVVSLCRDFLAQFSAYEISQLPEGCRPSRLLDGNDVSEYAFDLIRHRCDDGLGAEYAAHRLTAFFTGATGRLTQILHRRSQDDAAGDSQAQSA
jgi:hypothetical protein